MIKLIRSNINKLKTGEIYYLSPVFLNKYKFIYYDLNSDTLILKDLNTITRTHSNYTGYVNKIDLEFININIKLWNYDNLVLAHGKTRLFHDVKVYRCRLINLKKVFANRKSKTIVRKANLYDTVCVLNPSIGYKNNIENLREYDTVLKLHIEGLRSMLYSRSK